MFATLNMGNGHEETAAEHTNNKKACQHQRCKTRADAFVTTYGLNHAIPSALELLHGRWQDPELFPGPSRNATPGGPLYHSRHLIPTQGIGQVI